MQFLFTRLTSVVALVLVSFSNANKGFTFLTIGDWGGAALNGGKAANSQEYRSGNLSKKYLNVDISNSKIR